jgi:hypothetical protein
MTIETLYNILILVGITAIVGLFFGLAFYSNILRDDIDNPAAFMFNARQTTKYKDKAFNDVPRPFSLARTQFAVWTTIIASVYLSCLLKHGAAACSFELKNSTTTLALLGISAATTTLSGMIDKTQGADSGNTTPRHQNTPSKNFWFDILSDENGISIHRFQNVVWTVVAIVVYFYKLQAGYEACKLPELDGTILMLAGLSSAAYLGLKINENN